MFVDQQEGDYPPKQKEYLFDKNWFEIKELASGTLAIQESHHFEGDFMYGARTPIGGILLFDSGLGVARLADVLPSEPQRVFLTHSHWDHMGGAHDFQNITMIDIPSEVEQVKRGWKKDQTGGDYDPAHFKIPLPPATTLDSFVVPGIPKITTMHDLETITVDGLEVLAIHTPGHTPGSSCFFIPSTGELIAGDTLYPGPEYLHLPDSDPETYLASLIKLKNTLREKIKNILPGHGKAPVTPQLLVNHIDALQGSLHPLEVLEGEDQFGPYIEKKYEDFSLMLPRR